MKNGRCPKCGSTDIRSGEFLAKKADWIGGNRIPISMGLHSYYAWLDNYVCVRCGYVESYIANPKKLAEIAERWPAVSTTPPDPPEGVWPRRLPSRRLDVRLTSGYAPFKFYSRISFDRMVWACYDDYTLRAEPRTIAAPNGRGHSPSLERKL